MIEPIKYSGSGIQSFSPVFVNNLASTTPTFQTTSSGGFFSGLGSSGVNLSGLGNLDFDSDPLGGVSTILDSVGLGFVGDAVETVTGFLGIGPEDWSSVKARAEQGVQNIINYGLELMTSKPTGNTLSLADKYYVLEIARLKFYLAIYKSSNSRNSIKVQIQGIEEFRNTVKQSLISKATIKSVSSPWNKEGLLSLGKNSFPSNQMPSNVTHYVYTDLKTVQTVTGGEKPVPTQNGVPLNTDNNEPPKKDNGNTLTIVLFIIGFFFRKPIAKILGIKI